MYRSSHLALLSLSSAVLAATACGDGPTAAPAGGVRGVAGGFVLTLTTGGRLVRNDTVPAAGVRVELRAFTNSSADTVPTARPLAADTTGADGSFEFTRLAPGPYVLLFRENAGWHRTVHRVDVPREGVAGPLRLSLTSVTRFVDAATR
jgi:hypothetical protein